MPTPPHPLRARFWVESALAAVSAGLALITIFAPTWIEEVFGIEPDGGNGELEWLIVAVPAVLAAAAGALAGYEWRRAMPFVASR